MQTLIKYGALPLLLYTPSCRCESKLYLFIQLIKVYLCTDMSVTAAVSWVALDPTVQRSAFTWEVRILKTKSSPWLIARNLLYRYSHKTIIRKPWRWTEFVFRNVCAYVPNCTVSPLRRPKELDWTWMSFCLSACQALPWTEQGHGKCRPHCVLCGCHGHSWTASAVSILQLACCNTTCVLMAHCKTYPENDV